MWNLNGYKNVNIYLRGLVQNRARFDRFRLISLGFTLIFINKAFCHFPNFMLDLMNFKILILEMTFSPCPNTPYLQGGSTYLVNIIGPLKLKIIMYK